LNRFPIQNESLKSLRAWAFGATLAVLSTFGTACSVGLFDKVPGDSSILGRQPYRRVNLNCSGMDLSSSSVDAGTARKIVRCFNSEGGLEPLSQLLAVIPDDKLKPLLDVGNRHIFQNERMLFELQATYQALEARGTLQPILTQLGKVLENEELVVAALALFKQTTEDRSAVIPTTRGGSPATPRYRMHPSLLAALKRLSVRVTPEAVGDLLDGALMVGRSDAGQALHSRLRGESPQGRELERDFVVPLSLLFTDRSEGAQNFARRPLELLAQGKIFQWLDDFAVIGPSSDAIRASVPRMGMMLGTLGATSGGRDAAIADDLTTLFHHARAPIRCLRGQKEVRDAAVFLVREMQNKSGVDLQDFLTRSNPILLSAMNAVCTLPPALGATYPVISDLALRPAIFPATDLIKGAVRQGIDPWLLDLLSYAGPELGGRGGIKHLLPIMAELTDRKAWDDLLYLLSLPTDRQRRSLIDWVRFVLEPMSETNPQSLLDVAQDMLARASVTDLYRLLKAAGSMLDTDEDFLVPALSGLRDGLHTTDAHPLLRLARSIMESPESHEALHATLIELADNPTYRQQFLESIRLVSDLAKDGRLAGLLDSVLSLFSRFARSGERPVVQTTPVPLKVDLRHPWSSRTVPFLSAVATASDAPTLEPRAEGLEACRSLDLNLPFDETRHPRWSEQVENLVGCLTARAGFDQTASSIRYLLAQRTSSGANYVTLQIELLRGFGLALSEAQIADLADRWILSVHDLSFFRLLEGYSLLTQARFVGERESGRGGPVLEPLVDVLSDVYRHPNTGIRGLLDFSGRVLQKDSIPRVLRYADELSSFKESCEQAERDRSPDPRCSLSGPEAVVDRFDRARIERWVNNRECELNPQRRRERINQIIQDVSVSADSWSLDSRTGQPPRQVARQVFHEQLQPVFDKVADPAGSARDKSLTQAVINTLGYFSLEPREGEPAIASPARANDRQHYVPDYLLQWMRERSDDQRLISYFYPGQRSPRVRLVNTIEVLELVLVNADLQYLLPDHFGFKFLSMIGESWGDEPSDRWPEAVRRRYPRRSECDRLFREGRTRDRLRLVRGGDCPRTLEETFRNNDAFPMFAPMKSVVGTLQMFEGVVGYPDLPSCRQVLDPSNPGQDTPNPEAPTGGAPDFIIPDWVRASVFNMRQLLPVVEENLPGANHPHAGGLKVLRDLFYELHTSSPERCQNARSGECNNLSVLVKLVRLGMGRQGTQAIRSFPSLNARPESLSALDQKAQEQLRSLSRALVKLGGLPEFPQIAMEVLGSKEGQKLAWAILEQVFDILEASEPSLLPPARVRELMELPRSERDERLSRWAREASDLGALGFHGLSLLGRWELLPDLARNLLPILRGHRDYLTGKADLLRTVVEEDWILKWLRALHDHHTGASLGTSMGLLSSSEVLAAQRDLAEVAIEALRYRDGSVLLSERGLWVLRVLLPLAGENPSWEQFVGRFKAFRNDSRYEALRIPALLTDLSQFFQERPEDRPSGAATRIRQYVGERLKPRAGTLGARQPGDIEELVILMARDPAEFWNLLSVLGHHSRRGGELAELSELVIRSLESKKL
jgi:hypothetical protein